MKALSSAIVFGIGFLLVSGSPARAQLGGIGEAAKKGASDAVKQEVQKGIAEQIGLPTLTPAATPAATPEASAPVGEAKTPEAAAAPPADTGAAGEQVGEPEAAPEAAEEPSGTPGAAGTLHDAAEEMEKKIPEIP